MNNQARPTIGQWILSIVTAIVGVSWQYGSLALVDRWVHVYPSVPDVLMDRLPRLEFGWWGEVLFFALILMFAIPHFRWNVWDTPKVLTKLGLFYFVRGWLQLFFPIGAPLNALPPDQRLNVWGYASHAYFPGGHVGILTIMALNLRSKKLRWIMAGGIIVFGLGTILSKNHYTADLLAGALIGYAVNVWVDRRWPRVDQPRLPAL